MSAKKTKIPAHGHTPEYTEHVVNAAPHRLSVSWDRWNTRENKLGKGYLSFETRAELAAWYARQPQRCVYEILRETAPISVGFDVECDFKKRSHLDVREALHLSKDPDAFLADVRRRLEAVFPQLAREDPFVSNSHKPGAKLSFHLKYAHLYLRDMEHRDQLTRVIREQLEELVPVVDPSVYSLRRQMRLLWSHKHGDSSRPLLPVPAPPEMDAATLEAHSWTAVRPGAVPLDLSAYGDEDEAEPMDVTRVSSSGKRSRSTATRTRPERDAAPSDDSWVAAVRDLLRNNKLADSADRHVDVRSRAPHGPRGSAYFRTAGTARTCPYGETHESNNFVVNVTDYGLAFLHCFGTACKEKKDHRLGFLAAPPLPPRSALADAAYASTLALALDVPAESVSSPTWVGDKCHFEVAAHTCKCCSARNVTRVHVSMSKGGKATHGHLGRDGSTCSTDLYMSKSQQMHDAFREARDADSRTLTPEEIARVARALDRPEFEAAERGWSSALELRIILALDNPAQRERELPYLMFVGGREPVSWRTKRPWVSYCSVTDPATETQVKAVMDSS